jgi:hypothetical protein
VFYRVADLSFVEIIRLLFCEQVYFCELVLGKDVILILKGKKEPSQCLYLRDH